MAVFTLQGQGWAVTTEKMCLGKPKVFTNWPFAEKVFHLLEEDEFTLELSPSLSFSARSSLGPGHTKLSFYLPSLFQMPESSNVPTLLKRREIGRLHGLGFLLASSPHGASPCRSDGPLSLPWQQRLDLAIKSQDTPLHPYSNLSLRTTFWEEGRPIVGDEGIFRRTESPGGKKIMVLWDLGPPWVFSLTKGKKG